jgi:sulfonate transport system substrate-binding protein
MKWTMLRIYLFVAAIGLGLLAPRAARADAPSVIRIGYPGVGVGNRPASSGNTVATMHLKGMLEDEFKNDGVQIRWSFFPGAGPAVNDAYANGLLDFSDLGDLPSVVGRASGIAYRVLASAGVRGNLYVSVPSDSTIQSLAELRGKRISVQKGTATHLAILKILDTVGLSASDVHLVDMTGDAAKNAIIVKGIDAAAGGSDWLALKDQGVARVLFSTVGGDAKLTSNSTFVGAESFIRKYPDITQRVINTYVKAVKWMADQAQNPNQTFMLWTKSGVTLSSLKADWKGEDFKYKTSPLLDPYVVSRYEFQIHEAKRLGLARNTFSFADFVDASFLTRALQNLHLESFWKPRDLNGNPPPGEGKPSPVAAAPRPQ